MKKICLFIFLMLMVGYLAHAWTVHVPETKIGGDLTVTGDLVCTTLTCLDGILVNDAGADGSGDLIVDDDSGNVLFKIDVSEGTVRRPTRASLVVAGADTIPADACGGVKRISSAADVTTNTTDTFTAAATINDGCMMSVQNIGSYAITLDGNSGFNSSLDYILDQGATIEVYSTGDSGAWFVINESMKENRLRYLTRTISSAQLLALFTTPVELIPSIADYIIDIEKIWIRYNYGGTNYDGIAAGEDLRFYITNFGSICVIETTGWLDQGQSLTRMCHSTFPTQTDATTPVGDDGWSGAINQAFNVNMLIDNIATGDGTLIIRIFYRIVPK